MPSKPMAMLNLVFFITRLSSRSRTPSRQRWQRPNPRIQGPLALAATPAMPLAPSSRDEFPQLMDDIAAISPQALTQDSPSTETDLEDSREKDSDDLPQSATRPTGQAPTLSSTTTTGRSSPPSIPIACCRSSPPWPHALQGGRCRI